MSPEQVYGHKWEKKLVRKLKEFGKVRLLTKDNWTEEIDIKLNDKLIHCKAAQSKRQKAGGIWRSRYQFNFSMVNGGDFIIAICDTWGKPVHFIIPVCELNGRRGMYITSHPLSYSGYFSKYRENWSLLCQ